jgi:hypothetical protein
MIELSEAAKEGLRNQERKGCAFLFAFAVLIIAVIYLANR